MNSEAITTTEHAKTDFSWWSILVLYGVMVTVVTMIHGVPSGNINGVAHVMIPYAAEAFAPLMIAMILTGIYHGIRQGKSAWVRNTVFTSIVVFGFYLVGVSGV